MEYFTDISCCIHQLKSNNCYIFSLEEDIHNIPISLYCFIDFEYLGGRNGVSLVVGAEMVGINKK